MQQQDNKTTERVKRFYLPFNPYDDIHQDMGRIQNLLNSLSTNCIAVVDIKEALPKEAWGFFKYLGYDTSDLGDLIMDEFRECGGGLCEEYSTIWLFSISFSGSESENLLAINAMKNVMVKEVTLAIEKEIYEDNIHPAIPAAYKTISKKLVKLTLKQ